MTRTTQDGVSNGQPGRFTPGFADAVNTPTGGPIPGKPPFVWMTGGGTAASADPSKIGMDVKLDALTAAGFSIVQPDTPWYLGGPGSTGSPPGTPGSGLRRTEDAIADAIAWSNANLGTVGDPILMGVSNGWVCSIIYARDRPVLGIIGFLTVTAGVDGYLSNDQTLRGLGLRERIALAWNADASTTPPTLPTDLRFSPYDDVNGYLPENRVGLASLYGKVQGWYACNDPILVTQQMNFLQRIRAEMHNVGAFGHLGSFFDGSLPVTHADTTKVVNFALALAA